MGGCLPLKRLALFLCPQPGGHLEFLPELAQAPVSFAARQINQGSPVVNYNENQEYQREFGISSQEAQDEQNERYSSPDIKDNSKFTLPLDSEGFPLVELGLINAGEIGRSKVLDFNFQIGPPFLKSSYQPLHSGVNSVRRLEGKPCGLKEGV
jgi:hypothetical protein